MPHPKGSGKGAPWPAGQAAGCGNCAVRRKYGQVGVLAEANEPDQELVMKLKTLLKNNPALLEQLLSEDA